MTFPYPLRKTYGYSRWRWAWILPCTNLSVLEKVALYTIRYDFVTGKKAMENRDSDNGGKTILTGTKSLMTGSLLLSP